MDETLITIEELLGLPMTNNQHLGLVDNMNYGHVTNAYAEQEYSNSRPAVEASQPATQPQPYQPDTWVQGGTILSDTYYNVTDSGVQEVTRASANTTAQWEADVRQRQQELVQGRSRYNTPPTSGGFTPYLDVSEGKKATPEELEAQRNRETADSLTAMIGRLKREEGTLRLKLQHNLEAQRRAKQRLEELAD